MWQELSAFLAAEGSFVDDVAIGVHLRIRLPDTTRPSRLAPPTSAVSFWQVEFADRPTSGGAVRYDDRVCLRHVLTRKYLTLRTAGSQPTYTLTASRSDGSAAFRFKAVGSEEANIKLGSFARIQHALSGERRGLIC